MLERFINPEKAEEAVMSSAPTQPQADAPSRIDDCQHLLDEDHP